MVILPKERDQFLSHFSEQPKYSPELNPIERFGEEIKRKLRWRNYKTLEELRQNVSNLLAQFDPASIASLIGWDSLTETILSATL